MTADDEDEDDHDHSQGPRMGRIDTPTAPL
jgi:hypothetical protein